MGIGFYPFLRGPVVTRPNNNLNKFYEEAEGKQHAVRAMIGKNDAIFLRPVWLSLMDAYRRGTEVINK